MIKKVTIKATKTGNYHIDINGWTKNETIRALCNAIAYLSGELEKAANQKPEPRPDHPPVTQAELFIEE